jgi:hypothetical protein
MIISTRRYHGKKTGFHDERRDGAAYLAMNEAKSRQSTGVREVWENDAHVGGLTERRLSQNWS